MRLLVDECVGPSVVRWLRENNYDAISAFEDCRGWEDESILEKACSEGRIVVTMDKDLEIWFFE
jgi:predicted nuclease of predicted toxin-antitoxin system